MMTETTLQLVMAQINFCVGDIAGNTEKIIQIAQSAHQQLAAEVVIFPELALTGYPPEDLLLRPDFHLQIEKALQTLCEHTAGIDLIVGYPHLKQGQLYNAAAYLQQGRIIATYHKQELPNYGVFDEKRYFTAGDGPIIIEKNGFRLALAICEDLWHTTVTAQAKAAAADVIISINASPFDMRKPKQRDEILRQRCQESALPILYVHGIGGQDELVFDGRSLAMNAEGTVMVQGPSFEEALLPVTLHKQQTVRMAAGSIVPETSLEETIYRALVLAVKDYVHKNSFSGALLGLSGGIDSALTLTIAVDALGPHRVEAILLPSRHTSAMSIEDAEILATNLKVAHRSISIEPAYETFLKSLSAEFTGYPIDKTEENLQARCRGVLLMAISNKKGSLLLTTGNKSEMAVGYATLYGDMAGGFAVIKDIPKTWVYRLAHFRNSISPVIPQRIIDRPPTAELAPNQTDQDTLPPYDELDDILQLYVEQDRSLHDIVATGHQEDTVKRVLQMVDRAEHKRRQAPPGPRITSRAFGRERRYPITSRYCPAQQPLP
jgi:NAD+ synthase (glutamine-hydrolysing)